MKQKDQIEGMHIKVSHVLMLSSAYSYPLLHKAGKHTKTQKVSCEF